MSFRWTIRITALLLFLTLLVNSCKKSSDGGGPNLLQLKIPEGFPTPQYNFEGNPLTEEGFQLGRRLFYDGRLSKDGNFPCASCHQQFAAFANFDHDLSHGFNNQFTLRNSPGLFNMIWLKALHWDGGIAHIENQPLAPITAPNEMAEDINTVLEKLRADARYPAQFKAAFGDETINSQRMLKAITQFVGSIISADSKYDRVQRGEVDFNSAESAGYALFKANCSSCHAEPLFTDGSFRNTGLPKRVGFDDAGRMRITGNPADSLKFKVPSLRNVMITFPYGHDGRFASVKGMMDHYSDGIKAGPGVDPLVRNNIPLTALDKFYLTQFLYTLTDSSLLTNPRFSQPD